MSDADIKFVSAALGEVIEVTDRVLKELKEFNQNNAKKKKLKNKK